MEEEFKKKRGRKPRSPSSKPTEKILKRRGRKPNGGKIIHNSFNLVSNSIQPTSIIVHLKCTSKQLLTDDQIIINDNTDLLTPNTTHQTNNINNLNNLNNINNLNNLNNSFNHFENTINQQSLPNIQLNESQELTHKIKVLEHNLHFNNTQSKQCACFWDTCHFDTSPIYIPKTLTNDNTYIVYGCFCSIECATAYLFNEKIDQTTKYERYQLLNNLYMKPHNYSLQIKRAPQPFYTIDKFYGNLSITDYRSLTQNNKFFMIIDKPLSKIMPELYNDNEISTSVSNNFKSSNNLQKNTKTNIVFGKFGL